MKMTKQERQRRLLAILQDGNLTTAIRLSNIFDVSEATVIRDFNELRAEGYRIEGSPGMGGGTMLRQRRL